jgi:hypothetical protein
MKTTLDIPDDVYRRLKAKSAMQGQSVRQVAIALFRGWIGDDEASAATPRREPVAVDGQPVPPWFGSLRRYAANAQGRYDLESVRSSIARGRVQEGRSR